MADHHISVNTPWSGADDATHAPAVLQHHELTEGFSQIVDKFCRIDHGTTLGGGGDV